MPGLPSAVVWRVSCLPPLQCRERCYRFNSASIMAYRVALVNGVSHMCQKVVTRSRRGAAAQLHHGRRPFHAGWRALLVQRPSLRVNSGRSPGLAHAPELSHSEETNMFTTAPAERSAPSFVVYYVSHHDSYVGTTGSGSHCVCLDDLHVSLRAERRDKCMIRLSPLGKTSSSTQAKNDIGPLASCVHNTPTGTTAFSAAS